MELLKMFPPTEFSLMAIILGMPLLGAFINGIWGHRLGKPAVRLMALTAVGVSFLASVVAFFGLHELVEQAPEGDKHVKLVWSLWDWMSTTAPSSTEPHVVPISIRFSIDALSGVMMLVVTGVGFLIHLYATSYMAEDKSFARFFAYMNLFIFSMLVLILGDNLPLLFVGWEGVGLCSYLLIGFWYTKAPNATAGKKAFIANRIGDFGLICGMFLLAYYCGSLDWSGMSDNANNLLSQSDRVHVWPIGGGTYSGVLGFLQPKAPVTISPATAVGIALLLGCAGKSAQIPLYVWLPDAMAGPTPVSALIHAATMVTAGIYLICRMSFAFVLSPFTMMIIAIVGAATALFAATIALVQNDIKKVLAYSTVSQLGFMFLGVGVGAFASGFFHVFTHAFFKACLFLGAGSVIHAMHARVHDDDKAQDIRNMGGLRKYMPLTFWTFAASTAAIVGFPFTSGFFSKDEILYRAFTDRVENPMQGVGRFANANLWSPPPWIGSVLFGVALVAAVMTAFYMCRMFFITFYGDFRGWVIGRPSMLARHELAGAGAGASTTTLHDHDHDHDHDHAGEDEDEEHHPHEDLASPGYPPHESPWQMTVPLIILAAFAVFAGILNLSPGLIPLFKEAPMEHWLDPVFEGSATKAVHVIEGAKSLEWPLALGGIAAFLIGSGLAYWIYIAKKGEPARQMAAGAPRLYKLVLNKWKIDELYDATVLAAVDSLAETSAAVDKWIVDGIIARLTSLVVAALGTILRAFQNGVVHVYAAMMVIGLALVGLFFVVPHAEATVTAMGNNQYAVQAGPGMGYSFRWDMSGEGNFGDMKYGDEDKKTVEVKDQDKTVILEVRNAFGYIARKAITLSAPPKPLPPAAQGGG